MPERGPGRRRLVLTARRALASVVDPSLRNARGEPSFNVKFYILNAAAEYASVALYGGDEVRVAVCTEKGARLEPCDALVDGAMQP